MDSSSGSLDLEVCTGVALSWGMVGLQSALERGATGQTAASLTLLRTTAAVELASTSTVVDQILVIILLSLAAEAPEEKTRYSEDDGTTDTNTDTDNGVSCAFLHAGIVTAGVTGRSQGRSNNGRASAGRNASIPVCDSGDNDGGVG